MKGFHFLLAFSLLFLTSEANNLKANSLELIPAKTESLLKVNQSLIENKVKTLKLHPFAYKKPTTPFAYEIRVISASDYQAQKPANALPFDAGYLGSNGVIVVSAPNTPEQIAVFKDIDQVALFYLCQSYIRYYYVDSEMPLWFKYGFAAFEAHLQFSDAIIKTALTSYGGTISSFSILNDPNTFVAKNGIALAYMFGEFMSVYHCWHYNYILSTNAQSIEVSSWWWETETLEKLLNQWNRYLNRRIMESNEDLRIKLFKETDHFLFYTRNADAFNFPTFSDTLEKAYTEYTAKLNVQTYEKLTYFTIPECEAALINDVPCGNRVTSGTAWSSGLNASCANNVGQLGMFTHQNRHELAHVMQNLIPQGTVTAWMNEGFPEFYSNRGPISQKVIDSERSRLKSAMDAAIAYHKHRPTYEESRIYPTYDYYLLGKYFVDFIYRKGGGHQGLKDIYSNDVAAYAKLGYASAEAFMSAFYYDFDVRIMQKPIVQLLSPALNETSYEKSIPIKWTPIDPTVKLNVYVSMVNADSWTEIVTNTTQSSCTWSVPDGFTGKFYLKFRSPEYQQEIVLGPFTKDINNTLSILYPNGGESLLASDSAAIRWSGTSIPAIRIDYSIDNGASWLEIKSNVASSKRSQSWYVPSTLSNDCKIRITDMTNSSITAESQSTFKIIESIKIGGPYMVDNNTVVLLHFDNDLKNQSTLTGDGIGIPANISYAPSQSSSLGQCVKTTTPITIGHCANLSLTGDWTIEAWVKLTEYIADRYQLIVSKPGDTNPYESNYSILVNPWWENVFHSFYFSKMDSRIGITAAKPVLNEWHHVVFIRDTKKSELKIEVRDKNLSVISTQTQPFTGNEVYVNSKDLLIGENFSGYIDELRISNTIRKFEKPLAPSAPTPSNNSTNISSVNLSWSNGEGTDRVDLYLSKTNPPAALKLDNVPAVSTYTLTALDPSTKYYWKVVCKNIFGITEGPVWSFTTNNTTGINDGSEADKVFRLYPNPTSDFFNIASTTYLDQTIEMKIFNSNGQLIYSNSFILNEVKQFNTMGFEKGLYFIQLKGNSAISTDKLVIQ